MHRATALLGKSFNEVIRQDRDIRPSITQWFDEQFHDLQAEVEILAEQLLLDRAFEVAAVVTIIVNDDVEAAANMVRPMLALYMGGMGARGQNFHFDVFVPVADHTNNALLQFNADVTEIRPDRNTPSARNR